MATFAKSAAPLLVLLTLLFFLQTLARESRLFGKGTRVSPENSKPFLQQSHQRLPREHLTQRGRGRGRADTAAYGLYGRQADVEFPPSTATAKKYNQQQDQPVKEDPNYYNNNRVFNNVEESIPAAAATSATSGENDPDYSGSNDNDGDYFGSNGNDGYYGGSTESFNKNYNNSRPGSQDQQREEEFDFDP